MINLRGVLTVRAGLTTASPLIAMVALAADQDRWPSTSANKPTPKVQGMPEILAKNLANFDDLDFHVYTAAAGSRPRTWCMSRESWLDWTHAQLTTADSRAG